MTGAPTSDRRASLPTKGVIPAPRPPISRSLADDGRGLLGMVFRGRRYDTGDRDDYLKTVIRLACERPDLGPDLQQWIRTNLNVLAPLAAYAPMEATR